MEHSMQEPRENRRFSWREALLLALVLALALGVRLAWLAEYSPGAEYRHPLYDPEYNAYWARGLALDQWTPPEGVNDPEIRTTPYGRPPGYPFFLAGVYTLFGVNDWAPRAVQTVLGLINVVLLFSLGRALFGPLAALLSALLMALCWAFPYYESQLTYPAVVVFLLLLSMRLIASWAHRPRVAPALLLGALLGLFGLFRPNGLLFLPVLVLWMFWAAKRRGLSRRALPAVVLLLVGVAAAIAPVFVRNYRVTGDFVFISSYGGLNFYVGNHPDASLVEPRLPELKELAGVENWSCFDYPAIVRGLGRKLGREPLPYSEANRWFYAQGLLFIREHPGQFLENTARKTLLFWGPKEVTNDTVPELDRAHSAVLGRLPGFSFALALFAAGAVCFFAVRRRDLNPGMRPGGREGGIALLLFILAYFLSVLPYFIAGRYRMPILPFMLVFGGYGLARALQWIGRRRWRHALGYALVLATAGAAASWNFAGYEPSAGTWHLRRALAWSADGVDERALAEYQQALDNGADAALVQINMGRIRARQGDSAAATMLYEKALEASPENAVAHNNLGYELYRLGRTEDALKHYRAAIEASPVFALPHINLGMALLDAGDAAAAGEQFRTAAELEPGNAGAAYNLGRALAAQGDTRGAFDAYSKAIALKPDFAEAHNNLGLLLETEAAITCFRRAVEIAPAFTLAWNNLGNALLEKGDDDGAVGAYNSALSQDAKDPFAHYNLGRVHEAQGRLDTAEAEYRKAIEADAKFVAAHRNLGRVLGAQGRAAEAAAAFDAALALLAADAPERAEIAALRANCAVTPATAAP
jgi:tetratricopeptide (TPR) repeat protein